MEQVWMLLPQGKQLESCFSSHSIRLHSDGGYTLRYFTNLRPEQILDSGIIIHGHTLLICNSKI